MSMNERPKINVRDNPALAVSESTDIGAYFQSSDSVVGELVNTAQTPSDTEKGGQGQNKKQTAPQDPKVVVFNFLRQEFAERLKPDRSGITLQQLNEATKEIQTKVREIIAGCIARAQELAMNGSLPALTHEQYSELGELLFAYQFGLGLIDYVFKYPDIEDIIITTERDNEGEIKTVVWSLRRSGRSREPVSPYPEEVITLINKHLNREGKTWNFSNPIVDGRLINGARVAAIMYPLVDPLFRITIRVPNLRSTTMEDLIRFGSITPEAAAFLALAVRGKLSIVVAGSTGSGKTTMLQALCDMLRPDESVVCIEDTRELRIPTDVVSYFQTAYQSSGEKRYTQNHLAIASMRHIPERIVFGEVRDGAAWEAIKLANSGHPMLLTVHSEDADGILERLLQLANESPMAQGIKSEAILKQIVTGYTILIFLTRRFMPDGTVRRHVSTIIESPGIFREGVPVLNTLFAYNPEKGMLDYTQIRPHEKTMRRLAIEGISHQMVENALRNGYPFWREYSATLRGGR